MSAPGAVLYLWACSAKNRLRLQLRRLRRPRYLLGLALALVYLWWFFLRRLPLLEAPRALPPVVGTLFEVPLLLMGVGSLLASWLFGGPRSLLTLTEAEAQLLLPAPLSWRQLLHMKLVRFLARGALGALLSGLLLGRGLSGHPLLFALGSWLGLSLLGLHAAGASLVRASLARRHASWLGRRGPVLAGVLLWVGLAVASGLQAGRPPWRGRPDPDLLADWALDALGSGLLPVLLAPVRLPLQVAFARSLEAALWPLLLSLLLLLVHYRWVLAASARLPEAALPGEAGGPAVASPEQPTPSIVRARPPLPLGAVGHPAWALVWKNLTAGRRVRTGRLAGALLALGAGGLAFIFGVLPPGSRRQGLAGLCLALVAFLTLLGPGALRLDLRLEVRQLEQLKALPLRGRQVVAAELAAPALVLACVQWGLLGAAAGLGWTLALPGLTPSARLALLGTAALLAPTVTLAGLLVHNALVLLFPAWMEVEEAGRGLEAMGQRLLTLMVTLLALLVGGLPPLLAAALVAWAWPGAAGAGALALGGAAGAGVLLLEVGLGVLLLGRLFERMDVSEP